MNFKATEQRTTKVELAVLKSLKSFGDFNLSDDKFSTYDLYGETGGEKTLIEIKERSKIWNDWYIEKDKIDKLIKLKNSVYYKIRLYLIIVVKDISYLYNVEEIIEYKTEKKLMKSNTNECFSKPKKILKTVYLFPFTIYKLKLKI